MVNVFTTLVGIGTRTLHIFTVYLPLLLWAIWLQTYDFLIFLVSFVIPNRRKGKVIATGRPGHQGNWPKYIPPVQGLDSRSPCPGLNTLANHDILPHDGKRITYKQLSSAIQHAYNLAPTLADQLTASAAVLD
ncbi:hypothetical protein N7466_010783 [Penicillium verhagenii]|uniref:uncharacterized protein n=1 Tax=Penicillium verhagenii TaxID=1562060 RepID=UPI002544F5BB|nr:uncharacterized protein N7466_010783 [Penicillium verhagenii]KAJ5917229.1 hypothetical protein N7466_010783 [Penicillium verhagenii]